MHSSSELLINIKIKISCFIRLMLINYSEMIINIT